MTAPLAPAHALQYLAPRLLGEIKIDNGEVGTGRRPGIYRFDKLYRLLAVRNDNKLALNAVLFQGPMDQTGICGIVLRKKNEGGLSARLRPARLRRAGL